MLDINLIREKPDVVRENIKRRKDPEKLKLLDEAIKLDDKWRKLLNEANNLRKERNEINQEINELKKQGKDAEAKVKEAAIIANKIKQAETETNKLEADIRHVMLQVPNILHESVPFGKDDNDNVEIRVEGQIPKFDFTPKDHLEVALNLGIIDQERAAKVSGRGFLYYKKDLVLLEQAIIRFALEFLINKKGFTPIAPPFMIRRKPYEGVTALEDFKDVMYKIEGEDLYLIATSEHPMAAMFMDEILDAKNLPIKFAGLSPCFRKEVGAHGKYTKGLFRMHQFNKIEQFVFCLPEDSWKIHEEIQQNCEELYKALGLCYRVLNVCTGDIGIIAAKKYDTDVWMADGQFREIGSNSNCTDYQARRLNIRFRSGEGQGAKGFVHTLNNTALATSRTMMTILEQFQQKDGSVLIPKVLHPFMNGITKIEKKI